ncbi:MAG: hypothetical protein IIA87_01895 [Nanoarchaeota archaeon]|nr:hypothetical protein [Nanoarchaeota archaeon]
MDEALFLSTRELPDFAILCAENSKLAEFSCILKTSAVKPAFQGVVAHRFFDYAKVKSKFK